MTAFEIALTVILSFTAVWISILCGRVIAFTYKIEDKTAEKNRRAERPAGE